MMLLGFRGCGEHEEGFKVGLAAVKPLPSTTISIQTGPGHVHYVPGHPGQVCGSEPLDHLAQVCPAQGDELYSTGSPCGTALLVLRPGCWYPASSASCGLWTGHSWEGVQENRKGGCCWPWSELGPFSPPPLHPSRPMPSPSPPTRWQPCWSVTSPLPTKRSHANGFRRNDASWPELPIPALSIPAAPRRQQMGKPRFLLLFRLLLKCHFPGHPTLPQHPW